MNNNFNYLVKKYKTFYTDENNNIIHPLGYKQNVHEYISKNKSGIKYLIEKDKSNPNNSYKRDRTGLYKLSNRKEGSSIPIQNDIKDINRVITEVWNKDPYQLAIEHLFTEAILLEQSNKDFSDYKVTNNQITFYKLLDDKETPYKTLTFNKDLGKLV